MGRRVVIAEDEAIIRLDLKEILEAEGYEVVGETGRGDEAVELVARHQPDLAILDVKMPGIDGIEAARRISADHRVAVLILTAFSQRNLIEDARDAGVAAYLVKPFQRGELVPAIEKMIATPAPVILDVCVDKDECVFPMVPAGGANTDMILAPPTREVRDRAAKSQTGF